MGKGLSEKLLSEQVRRLQSIPFSPDDEDRVQVITDEMKRVLRRAAKSDDHCSRIIDRVILEEVEKFPAPATVMAIAREVSEEPEEQRAPSGCSECHDLGMRHIERESYNRGTQRMEMAEAMEYCPCEKGRWLSAKARQRALGTPAPAKGLQKAKMGSLV